MKQRFLHVWHGTDQTIIDKTSGVDGRACVRARGKHFEQIL